ncbi:tRNA (uracil-5-)-methyltransferase A-like protein, partial [Leptotrombidium deliense]
DVKVKIEDVSVEEKTQQKDVYSYVERDETCEKFKVEISNIPKYMSYVELKKLLVDKLNLAPQKIKLINRKPKFAFVAFKSEEQRDAALERCNDYEVKGCKLHVKKANPAPDPLVKKRKAAEQNIDNKKQAIDVSIDSENLEDQLNGQVAPLWKKDYEQQLTIKTNSYKEFLFDLYREIGKIDRNFGQKCPLLFKWWKTAKSVYQSCCPLMEIMRSPIIDGYRNKCEFHIGINKAVGFRLGLYKDGNTTVASPSKSCPILSSKMHEIIGAFEKYLKTISALPSFNNETNTGFWRQLTVRTTANECMIIVNVNSGNNTDEEIEQEMECLRNFFEENCSVSVTSFYLHAYKKRETVVGNQSQAKLISGKEFIVETMIDKESENQRILQFKISPFAFFQINTAAAEVCYQVIANLARLTSKTILLDICCGTGTIGLFLSSRVKHVIGIELNEDAVKDCRQNAADNHIENIEFISGKAEDVIGLAIAKAKNLRSNDEEIDLVCVIDPPRAGLNNSIVKLLRNTSAINRFVYVSCEPRIAKRNLIE